MGRPQQGDYCAVSTPWFLRWHGLPVPDIFGILIRIGTRSWYCHAFIYVSEHTIIEAQSKGASLADPAKYAKCKKVWSKDALTDQQRIEIIANAKSFLGRPYGFLDILYLSLATLGFQWNWLLKRVENQKRLICSQLVALAGEDAGVDAWLCKKTNACLVTPADLARHAESGNEL